MLSQLDLGLGALEIGVLLSSTLWGVTTVQFYVYLITPNKDPLWTKVLVYVVWILESLHTIFVWVYLYRLTVTFYGITAVIGEVYWSLSASSLFDGIIGAIVQMFFAYRIRLFSNSWTVTLISWLGSLLQLAANVGVTIISGEFSLAEFGARFNWIVEATLIINLAVDVINTAGLSYYLNRERTGVEQTDAILVKLVVWTVETGLVTAIAAAVELILSRALPTSALWIGISIFYAKLYSNSFLAILNGRSIIRRKFTTTTTQSGGASWNPTTDVHVTVIRTREDDVELEGVKRQEPSGPLSGKEPVL